MRHEIKALLGWLPSHVQINRRSLWRLFGWALDAFTIGVSVADIITDVLVLLEFRDLGYRVFFGTSLAIFCLAQASYAFLFTAVFASHRTPLARVVVFAAVFPFAQLVPVFTWVQALGLKRVDQTLEKLGLLPGSKVASVEEIEKGDFLMDLLQSKYKSHAGFMVEAFVEAVPQAVLQTVFIVVAHRTSMLNLVSVAISVFTIASKSYLVSYALDTATFVFNFLCVAADAFGLFACSTIIALKDLDNHLNATYLALALAGLVLSVVGGHALLWLAMLDDHLKMRTKKRWPKGVTGVNTVFFDLYLTLILAWILAIIPCMVLFAGARLSLLPVCVFRSMDPQLFQRARFYRGMINFLEGKGGGSPGPEARIATANKYIDRARHRSGILKKQLACAGDPSRHKALTRKWAAELFSRATSSGMFYVPPAWEHVVQQAWPQAGPPRGTAEEIPEDAKRSSPGMATRALTCVLRALASVWRRCRKYRAALWLEVRVAEAWAYVEEHTEIIQAGLGPLQVGNVFKTPTDFLMRVCAVVALVVTLVCAVPLALCHTLLVLLGVLFPALQLVQTCSAHEETAQLPCGLAVTYCCVVICALALAPMVVRRQSLWMELADLRGFPDPFYGAPVLLEIRKRHFRDTVLRQRLGHFLAQHTLSFVEV